MQSALFVSVPQPRTATSRAAEVGQHRDERRSLAGEIESNGWPSACTVLVMTQSAASEARLAALMHLRREFAPLVAAQAREYRAWQITYTTNAIITTIVDYSRDEGSGDPEGKLLTCPVTRMSARCQPARPVR